MAVVLCPCCGTLYDSFFVRSGSPCPRKDCACDEVFEVDDLMVYPIKELNEKGWATKYCCSGHVYDDFMYAYIMFYPESVPDSLPTGWHRDGNCIRYGNMELNNKWARMNEKERLEVVSEAMSSLYSWADSLDICEW